jgi:glycosyltransferase involved in cell wall biosynthesis
MSERPRSITAVLPAYNEAAVIATTARRVDSALRRSGAAEWEIIVVDDGSHDGTGDAVRALAGELPELRLVAHPANRGYGAALRSGFEAARSEAVWLLDSDGQFDPADLALLLPHYRRDALVAGHRVHRRDPLGRRLSNRAFFTLVRLRVGRLAADINCGFKLFPHAVGEGLTADGAMVSTELLLRAHRAGYQIVDVPVSHHPRTSGVATGAHPRVVLRAFGELARVRRTATRVAPPDGR